MTFSANTAINRIAGASFNDLTWGMASINDEIDMLYAQRDDEFAGISTERELREADTALYAIDG